MTRVLSIQSHVVAGAVGHGAATPALASWHGLEVWPVPTVILSNHAATEEVAGRRIPGAEIRRLTRGLSASGALRHVNGVLTGYLGTVSAAEAVADLVEEALRQAPGAQYLCDPVLGDTGPGLYLPSRVGTVYRRRLLQLADIATPNLFELGWLTRTTPRSIYEITEAARVLADTGPDCVAVTSVPAGEGRIGILTIDQGAAMLIDGPAVPVHLHGAGDFTAAFLLAELMRDRKLGRAAETTMSVVSALARRAAEEERDDLPVGETGLPPDPDVRTRAVR